MPEDWPPRLTDGLSALAASTVGAEFQHVERGETDRVFRVRKAQAIANGLILEFESGAEPPPDGASERIELAFLSFVPRAEDEERAVRTYDGLPDRLDVADVAAGTFWTLDVPGGDGGGAGTALLLGGNKYVHEELLHRGWIVVSTSGPGRYFERREHPLAVRIDGLEEIDAAAERIAGALDDEMAEWAYAAEAVLEYFEDTQASSSRRPRAILGFSIGALALPSAVARQPERFNAAVLVAGGVDLFEISRLTLKEDRGLEIEWEGGAPSAEEWARLDEAYLLRTRLDPYRTAPGLSGIPVLLYHAAFDMVVPARQGDLLRDRCPTAERIVLPTGHKQILRGVMQLRAGSIVDWIEKVTR